MSLILTRQRKTKDPCASCGLHMDLCICAEIPSLSLKSRLLLVIHHRELKRTTNTGRLAIKALTNSQMCVRGEERVPLDLTEYLMPNYRHLLFYPAEGAELLTPEFVARDLRPIQLIVPDGNWRQASKVHYRHKELKDLPRVMLKSQVSEGAQYLRKETKPEGMATLEAIAHAFSVLEGTEVGDRLLRLYQLKLDRTLQGRGQITTKT